MGGEKVGGDAVQVTALESPPRGRGKGGLKNPLSVVYGSPPRWRGKALYEVAQDIVHGITPALAGKNKAMP